MASTKALPPSWGRKNELTRNMIASSASSNATLLVTLGFAGFRAKGNLKGAFLFDL
jgi:hypothetical protein